MRSRDQGALDAPILSQGTDHARRGSRMRPDRRERDRRLGLATTQEDLSVTQQLVAGSVPEDNTEKQRKPRSASGG